MYLSKLSLNRTHLAVSWIANPYRVHQRLKIACDGDPRLLFRIEESLIDMQILVQSHMEPNWPAAFSNFQVLTQPAEYKLFDPKLQPGSVYRFRLLANPAYKKTVEKDGEKQKTRLGYFKQEDQMAWLRKKLLASGADLLDCIASKRGLQRSSKAPSKQKEDQVHLAVLFEGALRVQDADKLREALESGIGPAKGYGFGLLSLAKAS